MFVLRYRPDQTVFPAAHTWERSKRVYTNTHTGQNNRWLMRRRSCAWITPADGRKNLVGLSREELEAEITGLQLPKFRAKRMAMDLQPRQNRHHGV